ncbi:MAG: hypothetical protein ACAF41_14940 [Leptolyngbya sp. BL-A-14]
MWVTNASGTPLFSSGRDVRAAFRNVILRQQRQQLGQFQPRS